MRRLAILALLAVVLLASLSAAAADAQASSPKGAGLSSESESPINDQGSNYHYRSSITSVTPAVKGLSVQVLEFADRLLLTNHTGKTITIYGYQGEPYARVLANGTAEQNVRSPATYLNTSFYGNVTVPPAASPSAAAKWEVVDRTGQFEWHDHRIHWMSPLTPPEVKDKSKLTLIFDWQVPIEVGTRKGTISGDLYWTPASSKASVGIILLGVAIALAGLLFVLFVRRRRDRTPGRTGAGASPVGPGDPPREAW
ncbi:MAG TPA: hypothetical protein VGL68_08880 [Solirubrobacteraceae bacterium]